MKLFFIWNLCFLTAGMLIVLTHACRVDDYPIKCPPYGKRCAMHEFCHETQRDCVSCFPTRYNTNNESRFQFCLEFQFEAKTKMLDPSCIGACDAMFGRKTFFEVAATSTTTKPPSTTPTTQSTATTKEGLTCNFSSDNKIVIFGSIIIIILIGAATLILVFLIWKKLLDQSKPKPDGNRTPDRTTITPQNYIPLNFMPTGNSNSMGNLQDEDTVRNSNRLLGMNGNNE